MVKRYTRSEASRIIGLESHQLRYLEKLRLVRPRARWGERLYSFADLVALRQIKRLTEARISPWRLRRSLAAAQSRLNESCLPLRGLQLLARGRSVAMIHPQLSSTPFEPLTGQWVLPFAQAPTTQRLHQLASRSAEEWFDEALAWEAASEHLDEAARAYRNATELRPGWTEAQNNLGVVLYQLGEVREAAVCFRRAIEADPASGIAEFNLGCVLDEMGIVNAACAHLRRAVELMPAHADAHFNLARIYESRRQRMRSRRHFAAYLRLQPAGANADYARSRLRLPENAPPPSAVVPFRKPK